MDELSRETSGAVAESVVAKDKKNKRLIKLKWCPDQNLSAQVVLLFWWPGTSTTPLLFWLCGKKP